MHPLLSDRRRLALYLAAWLVVTLLLAVLLLDTGRVGLAEGFVLMAGPTLLLAFVCLAAWYPAKALPLARTGPLVLATAHLLAAAVASAGWLLLLRGCAALLVRGGIGPGLWPAIESRSWALALTAVLLYLLALAMHYLLIASADAREIEQREMEVKMLAREAELKALKAQLDPHFLFNSLNSIASLCGSNPASARTLTTMLAEYLRKSLRVGAAEAVTFSEELELAASYLAVERVRFGDRLQVEQHVDEKARSLRVPPLLLQPLVENAVTHGIGQMIEGGTVQIAAEVRDGLATISVENACDPDRVSRPGSGIGLANARRRIETFYGSLAKMEVVSEPSRYRVVLTLPA